MRIEGMDASLKCTVNSAAVQEKTDLPLKVIQPKSETNTNQIPDKFSEAFIRKAVEKVNQNMQENNRSVEFKIHEKTNEIIIKIIDSNTKEVIREIPSEKILDMFANMLEMAGLLVDERR